MKKKVEISDKFDAEKNKEMRREIERLVVQMSLTNFKLIFSLFFLHPTSKIISILPILYPSLKPYTALIHIIKYEKPYVNAIFLLLQY